VLRVVLCGVAGAGSALLGERAAMACTEAVEEVITEHYNDQLRAMAADPNVRADPQAYAAVRDLIRRHRDDEEGHRATAVEHGAKQAPLYEALSAAVKVGCYGAIWLAKRF
jgi:3-demethoxyubiquinol 3-hydroxylase